MKEVTVWFKDTAKKPYTRTVPDDTNLIFHAGVVGYFTSMDDVTKLFNLDIVSDIMLSPQRT